MCCDVLELHNRSPLARWSMHGSAGRAAAARDWLDGCSASEPGGRGRSAASESSHIEQERPTCTVVGSCPSARCDMCDMHLPSQQPANQRAVFALRTRPRSQEGLPQANRGPCRSAGRG